MTTAPKIRRPAPCLCLDCNRDRCLGIGKPLSFAESAETTAAGPPPREHRLALAELVIDVYAAGKEVPPELLRIARKAVAP